MNGYISKKALMEYTDNQESKSISNNDIARFPIADVVEVVRCRECIHDGLTSCPLCYIEKHTLCFVNHDAEFYCGNGERRSE